MAGTVVKSDTVVLNGRWTGLAGAFRFAPRTALVRKRVDVPFMEHTR